MENKILETDRKLINTLFGLDPVHWSRRENGELVYLNAKGQKFVYTPEQIQKQIDKKLAEKVQSVSQERNAEIPEERLLHANSTEGRYPKPGPKTRSVSQERNAEIPVKRQPHAASMEGNKELTGEQTPFDAH